MLIFCTFGFKSKAATTYDVDEMIFNMTRGTTYVGSDFWSGVITNHFEVEIISSYVTTYEDVVITYLSNSQDPYGQESLTFPLLKSATKSNFVGFLSSMQDCYNYTVENALDISTTGDSTSQSNNSIWCTNSSIGTYYTPSMISSSVNVTYSVDGTIQDKEAIVALVGDILVATVECRRVQKLWTGNSTVWSGTTTLYVFLNARQELAYIETM